MNIIKGIGSRTVPCGTSDNTSCGMKVLHGGEHGIVCCSANYGTKQFKQELVRLLIDEEAVHEELDRKFC
jgi:hypothetical protein